MFAVFTLGGAGSGGQPEIAGCPIFPASNPWNQRVDKLPVAANSATMIRSIGLDGPVHAIPNATVCRFPTGDVTTAAARPSPGHRRRRC